MRFIYRWLLAAPLLAIVSYAQSSTTGALTGAVSDPAGAALPHVTVTLANSATMATQTVVTGANGAYSFSMLPSGAYEVQFAAAGFKTARMSSVAVNVGEAPTLDAAMERGETAEPVPCQCRITVTTSSTSTSVNSKTITAVPLTTRNFTQILSMASGSAADVNNAGTLGRGTRSVNVNGNTSAGSYTLDGAVAPSAVPNPDTISELKIQTSQYDAVYGAQVPSTALITKSGEHEFHGDAWEFVRNDVFNANSFFRAATGQSKPNLKQNQFGATLGGPVRGRKLFFFGSYQGTRQVNGLDTTSTSNPILPPLTNDRSAAALAAQFCPANHPLDRRYLTFAGGKQLDCGNQTTATTAPINPVALGILQLKTAGGGWLVPVPQTLLATGSNAGLGFSSYSLPSTYNENQYLVNGDYLVTPKQTLAARVYLATIDQYRTFGSPQGYPGTPMVPGQGTPQALAAHDYVASLNLTSAFRKTLVNEARMSFTRSTQSAHGDGTPAATALGMTPADRFFDQPPEMTILGPLGSFRLFGTLGNDFATENKYYSWTDNLSWVHGSHRTRAGGFFLMQNNDRDDPGVARGRLVFQTFSDFLLGLSAAGNLSPSGRSNIQSVQASEGVGPRGEVQYHYRSYYGAAFLQNDYKASPRLNLNFGLRWEYVGPAFDTQGAIGNAWPDLLRQAAIPPASGTLLGNTVAANYDARLVNPYTGQPFGAPPAGVFVRSTSSQYRNAAPLNTFAPRFGFSWQPLGSGGRLAVRGGYGLFYQTRRASAIHRAALRAGIHQCGFQQQLLQPAKAVPHDHARVRIADSHLAALGSRGRARLRSPAASPMEFEHAVPPAARPHVRYRLRRVAGQPAAAGPRSQPTAAGVRRYAESTAVTTGCPRTASRRTPRRTRDCACRFWGRLPRRWRPTNSPARPPTTACKSRCVSRPRTLSRFRPLTHIPAPRLIRRSITTRTISRSIGRAPASTARTVSRPTSITSYPPA